MYISIKAFEVYNAANGDVVEMHPSTRTDGSGRTHVVTVAKERQQPFPFGSKEDELKEIGDSRLYFLDAHSQQQFIDDKRLTRMPPREERDYYGKLPGPLLRAFRSRVGSHCIRGRNNGEYCDDSVAYIKNNTVSGTMTKSRYVAVAVAFGEVSLFSQILPLTFAHTVSSSRSLRRS